MREIKFRAWDKKRNEWVHKYACNILGESILLGAWMQRPNGNHVKLEELNDIEVIQYTGLKDKNGKEVYEGDVVLLSKTLHEVKFYNGAFILFFQNRPHVYNPMWDIVEVIGNIHENSEILQ